MKTGIGMLPNDLFFRFVTHDLQKPFFQRETFWGQFEQLVAALHNIAGQFGQTRRIGKLNVDPAVLAIHRIYLAEAAHASAVLMV